MVSLLAMAEGLNSTISSTGKEDRVIILREGASSELGSGLAMSQVDVVANSPGIKSVDGEPLISAEVFSIIDLKKKGAVATSNLPMRGVQPQSFKIRPEIQIIEGRNFTSGTSEVIVLGILARLFSFIVGEPRKSLPLNDFFNFVKTAS